jgi:hypothetical protein
MVRLISMAMTGYYRTMQRPRAHQPLSMLKYDPVGTVPCLPFRCGSRLLRKRLDVREEEGISYWEGLVERVEE